VPIAEESYRRLLMKMSAFPNLRGEAKEVAESYYETLKTKLTGNDKIVINALSELANENKSNAKLIIEVIERRVFETQPEFLLAHMYLIDSICKNHWQPFSDIFNSNIVKIFVYVFSKANEKVRASLYKLRHTWTAAPLFSARLQELDLKVKRLDPAWPVLPAYPLAPTRQPPKSNKILINPAKFQQGMQNAAKPVKSRGEEEETERLRQELLKKEKELLEFKKQEIDKKLQSFKQQAAASVVAPVGVNSSSSTDETKISSTKKVESGSSSNKESRDPRRRRNKADESNKSDSKSSSRSDSKKTNSSDSSRRDKSPKKSKSEKSSSSSSNGSSSRSSSSRSSSSKDKKPSPAKKSEPEPKPPSREPPKKREREPSPAFSPEGSPEPVGRISPLPAPPALRIPKLARKSAEETAAAAKDEIKVVAEKRADKRPYDRTVPDLHIVPEKRPKPLIDLVDDDSERETSSPVIGWAKHKESNPDNYRTPVKEMGPFFSDQHRGQEMGPFGPWGAEDRGRGGHGFRGHQRGFRRERGHMRGRWNDGPRYPGGGPMMYGPRGGGRGGFGRGGRGGGPPPLPGLPGLPPIDIMNANPELIRKEVIPNMIKLGRECMDKGTINEQEFNEFFNQVMMLKETSLNREAELRQENKENRFHRGRGRGGLPGGPERASHNGDGVPPPAVPAAPPTAAAQHKNDLPLVDPAQLQEIKSDLTKNLNIDDLPRPIRYYGETATIVLEDNKICELNFKPERDARTIIIDDKIRVYCSVNSERYTDFVLNRRTHKIKIGKPTRELWIDGDWHECYFNNKLRVRIDGTFHQIYLPGPPPSVDIGVPRPDLCLGRVYVLVDGNVNDKIPLYLDLKPQFLIIGGKPHVWRFQEGFRECTINGHPFRTDFGGFPSVISVQGKKHYLRLTSLPPGVVILQEPGRTKPPSPLSDPSVIGPVVEGRRSPSDDIGLHASDPINQMIFNEMMNASPRGGKKTVGGPGTNYNTEQEAKEEATRTADQPFQTSTPIATPTPVGQLPAPTPQQQAPQQAAAAPETNINDLWAKLQSSGVFSLFGASGSSSSTGGGANAGIPGLDPGTPAPQQTIQEPFAAPAVPPPAAAEPAAAQQQKKIRRQSLSIRDVNLKSNDITLKTRQEGIIESLFGSTDLQCKSCGLRFSKEEMSVYSGHLDWHFRAKRRERDNAKKAQSRRWYYEKNDWIVSDEIEDDEQDMTEEEIILEQSLEVPTVAARREEGKAEETCPVCYELFNQIYKQGEGNEEGSWLLHNAMRDADGVAYHPECFKDKAAQEKRELETPSLPDPIKEEEEEQQMEVDTPPVEEQKPVPTTTTPVKDEPPAPMDTKEESPMKTEPMSEDTATIKSEPTTESASDNTESAEVDNNAEDKTVVKIEDDDAVKTEEAEEANKTVNLDTEDSSLLQAPVLVPQPKVDIKVSLTSNPQVERRESNISLDESVESTEDSEFDSEATVLHSKLTEEEREALKPRLKGRKLTVLPPVNKDTDMSGLCSIM